jgi:hypothetical protein
MKVPVESHQIFRWQKYGRCATIGFGYHPPTSVPFRGVATIRPSGNLTSFMTVPRNWRAWRSREIAGSASRRDARDRRPSNRPRFLAPPLFYLAATRDGVLGASVIASVRKRYPSVQIDAIESHL